MRNSAIAMFTKIIDCHFFMGLDSETKKEVLDSLNHLYKSLNVHHHDIQFRRTLYQIYTDSEDKSVRLSAMMLLYNFYEKEKILAQRDKLNEIISAASISLNI